MVTKHVSIQIIFIAIEAPAHNSAHTHTYTQTGPSFYSVTDSALGKNGNWIANEEVICRILLHL